MYANVNDAHLFTGQIIAVFGGIRLRKCVPSTCTEIGKTILRGCRSAQAGGWTARVQSFHRSQDLSCHELEDHQLCQECCDCCCGCCCCRCRRGMRKSTDESAPEIPWHSFTAFWKSPCAIFSTAMFLSQCYFTTPFCQYLGRYPFVAMWSSSVNASSSMFSLSPLTIQSIHSIRCTLHPSSTLWLLIYSFCVDRT